MDGNGNGNRNGTLDGVRKRGQTETGTQRESEPNKMSGHCLRFEKTGLNKVGRTWKRESGQVRSARL